MNSTVHHPLAVPLGYHAGSRPAWLLLLLSRRLAQHIIFWSLLFLVNAVSIGYFAGALLENVLCFGIRLPFILAVCYLNLSVLLPAYYYKGHVLDYVALVVASALLLNALNLFVFQDLMRTGWLPVSLTRDAEFTAFNFVYKGFLMMTLVGLTSGIKLSKDHFVQKQKAESIEKEHLATELALLKSQIQPHFFFNTLNNLYALTLKKSDLAPEVVLKLSKLMSYVLYETDQERTSLPKELAYIQSYIDLESLRFSRPLTVDFTVSGNPEHVQLPPLLLLPFIENSFKHSIKSSGSAVHISIHVTLTEDRLCLLVSNPCTDHAASSSKGIGLRNVKRRLDLLYEQAYTLRQERAHQQFTTQLDLLLT
ncbi:sensor histidine kinase [Hymenobacter terrenus]|uniref:sensor histidine kinase n=1 Tax=Hymenobacter terrenus TaxID=1629124 RepID=UPI0009E2B558|nr:sensor histidine kinase [Hymenobacter terrenus]